jgi:ABC-type phosphate transport system substrate-binding protein
MRRPHLIAFLVLGLNAGLFAQEPEEFVLIANSHRPETALSRDEVSRIFLHKDLVWPLGGDVRPVDQSDDLPVRERFSEGVHGRPVQAIQRYWLQQVFAGRGTPPPALQSDAEVLDYVARTAGAIGYVSGGIKLPGVKILRLRD